MIEFCTHEKHGGVCALTEGYCNLGACQYEELKEFAPVRNGRRIEDHDYLKCLECGVMVKRDFTFFDIGDWNYCPNCGARMDGAE